MSAQLGSVQIRYVIESTGKVMTAQVPESDLPKSELTDCITAAVEKWRFPELKGGKGGGGIAVVSYPFKFR